MFQTPLHQGMASMNDEQKRELLAAYRGLGLSEPKAREIVTKNKKKENKEKETS